MHHTPWKLVLRTALSAGLIAPLAALPAAAGTIAEISAAAGTSPVVINEAYLSGGSTGAAYKNKFIELYNSSDTPVSLDGWSVQYRSATATGAPSGVAALRGTIPAKGHFLIKGATNSAASTAPELPPADLDATGFSPSGTTGTIFLAKQPTALTIPVGSVIEPAGVADTSYSYLTQCYKLKIWLPEIPSI